MIKQLIDIRPDLRAKHLVITWDGDSHILGQGGNSSQDVSTKVETLLTAESTISSITTYSYGVSGQTLLDMASDAASQVDAVIDADKTNICLFMEDFNALISTSYSDVDTGAQHFADINEYAQARKDAGYDYVIFMITMKHRLLSASHPAAVNTAKLDELADYITLAYASAENVAYDYLIDLRKEPHFGTLTFDENDLRYFTSDGIHLNHGGINYMARYIVDAGFKKYFRI